MGRGRGESEQDQLPFRLIGVEMLPVQLYLGRSEPKPELMRPVENFAEDSYFMKPGGGLWTSSYRDGSSEWLRYSEQIGHRSAEDGRYLLQPQGCRVCTIRSEQEYRTLQQRYSLDNDIPLPPELLKLIDWERLAEDCDAIWLPEGRADMSIESPFHGWDVESVFWTRWSFTGVSALD